MNPGSGNKLQLEQEHTKADDHVFPYGCAVVATNMHSGLYGHVEHMCKACKLEL